MARKPVHRPHFKRRVTRDSLWNHGSSPPSCCASLMQSFAYATSTHGKALPSKTEGSAFIASLRACAKRKNLSRGITLHHDVLQRGLLDTCSDALVTMYAKCGELAKAQELLDLHKSRDVFSWTHLIQGYTQKGQGEDALNCFKQMRQAGISPDAVTFSCILKACGSIKATNLGEQIHDEIASQGLLSKDIVLGNALVDMYAKCGALAQARRVLEELPIRDVVSWSALIAGYTQHDKAEHALDCFERMQAEGLSPNAVTFACILKACGSVGAIDKGETIHGKIAMQGLLENNVVLGNAVVDMYIKCGALAKAHKVLENLPVQIVASWNALIAGYVQQGQAEQALTCYEKMQDQGSLSPDRVTFLCTLKACGTIGAADKGQTIHDRISRHGLLGNDVMLGNALVDMYAKCGLFTKARQVLEELPAQNVISWNALIAGYVQHSQAEQALTCLDQMQNQGLIPNVVTFTCALRACGSLKAAAKGESILKEIDSQGLLRKDVALGSALVDMYAKCGSLSKAQEVLDELPVRDVVSWSALITGYTQDGQGEQAITCFERMQHEGLSPNVVAFLCILKACSSVGATATGEQIHDEIVRRGLLEDNVLLGNALVDMYVKCGALSKAQRTLEELPIQNVVSWNALIAGYAQHGQGEQALICSQQMQHRGLSPDKVTLLCILKACGMIGCVEKAQMYFLTLSRKYGIKPDLDHYICMVDVLGRAGHLGKAIEVIQKMPSVDYPMALWSALLCACRKWGDVNSGRWAFEHAIQVDKSDASAYVLMADIYTAAGMQEDAMSIKAMRTENSV